MLDAIRHLDCTRAVPAERVLDVDMSRYLTPSFIRLDDKMSVPQQFAAVLVLHQMFRAGIVRTASFWGEAGYTVVAFDEVGWPYFRQGEEVAVGLGVRLEDYQNKPAALLALQLVAAAHEQGMMNVCVEWGMQVAPDTYIYSNGMIWSGLTPYQLPVTGPYAEDESKNLPLMIEASSAWRDMGGTSLPNPRSFKAVIFETMLLLASGRSDAVIIVLGHPAEGADDTLLLHYLPDDESLSPAGHPDKHWQTEDFLWWCREDIESGNFSRIGYQLKKSGQQVMYQRAEAATREAVQDGTGV